MTVIVPQQADVEVYPFNTPRGRQAWMNTRWSTVDYDICMSSIVEDEYETAGHQLTGWAIDIGAHIGAVTVTLALDNPHLRVLAVEIVPENVEVLRSNILRNKLEDRVTVIEKAAGAPGEISRTCYMRHRSHPGATTAYVNKHRFIGNSFWSAAAGGAFDSDAVEVESVSLTKLLDDYDIPEVSFLKIDAEGAEWAFLRDRAVSRVRHIIGEYHWDYAGQGDVAKGARPYKRAADAQKELARLLSKTHTLTIGEHPSIGHFTAVRK